MKSLKLLACAELLGTLALVMPACLKTETDCSETGRRCEPAGAAGQDTGGSSFAGSSSAGSSSSIAGSSNTSGAPSIVGSSNTSGAPSIAGASPVPNQ